MLPMEKSVTFTGACANKIIPSIDRSFVYKAKEGCHVRINILIYSCIIIKLFFFPSFYLVYIKKYANYLSNSETFFLVVR